MSLFHFLLFQILPGWTLCDIWRPTPVGNTLSDYSFPRALQPFLLYAAHQISILISKGLPSHDERMLIILIKSAQIMELQTCLSQSSQNVFRIVTDTLPLTAINQNINSYLKKISTTCTVWPKFGFSAKGLSCCESMGIGRSCSCWAVGTVVSAAYLCNKYQGLTRTLAA